MNNYTEANKIDEMKYLAGTFVHPNSKRKITVSKGNKFVGGNNEECRGFRNHFKCELTWAKVEQC